jgi:Flp pilus assembly protein TadB
MTMITEELDALRPAMILLAALMGGLTVTFVASLIDFTLSPSSPGSLLAAYEQDRADTAVERIGAVFLRIPGIRVMADMPAHHAWLRLAGGAPSVAAVVGLSGLLLGAGIAAAVLLQMPVLLAVGVIGSAYPFATVRSRANRVRQRVLDSLPDISALLAAEIAAGKPADAALQAVSEFGGPLARLIREAVDLSARTARPLIGRGDGTPGLLAEVAGRYDLPAVRSFAQQVDAAASRGTRGPQMMQALAKTLIIQYKDRALREAEALESRLAVPSVGFFFMPFVFLLLVPLVYPVIQSL